jgi:hypothetical protein
MELTPAGATMLPTCTHCPVEGRRSKTTAERTDDDGTDCCSGTLASRRVPFWFSWKTRPKRSCSDDGACDSVVSSAHDVEFGDGRR